MNVQVKCRFSIESYDHDGYCSGNECVYKITSKNITFNKVYTKEEINKDILLNQLFKTLNPSKVFTKQASYGYFNVDQERLKKLFHQDILQYQGELTKREERDCNKSGYCNVRYNKNDDSDDSNYSSDENSLPKHSRVATLLSIKIKHIIAYDPLTRIEEIAYNLPDDIDKQLEECTRNWIDAYSTKDYTPVLSFYNNLINQELLKNQSK